MNVTPGASAQCFGDVASISPLTECMSSASLAGWAVGGGVSLFYLSACKVVQFSLIQILISIDLDHTLLHYF